MKIVLATPLYPPDIAEPAPYIKELAKRLSTDNEVTVVTYGRYAEPVPGVRIIQVPKQSLLPIRLLRYALALAPVAREADVLYIENGPSVELPATAVSFLMRTPVVVHQGDPLAKSRAERHPLLRLIARLAEKRATRTITVSPVARPEVISFLPYPEAEMLTYEKSWEEHLERVKTATAYA